MSLTLKCTIDGKDSIIIKPRDRKEGGALIEMEYHTAKEVQLSEVILDRDQVKQMIEELQNYL